MKNDFVLGEINKNNRIIANLIAAEIIIERIPFNEIKERLIWSIYISNLRLKIWCLDNGIL